VPSGSQALFFNSVAATPSAADTASGSAVRALDLATTTTNGVATNACDFNQARHPIAPPLECQQSHQAPPIFFIHTGDHPIDGLMLSGHGAVWVFLAGSASTGMNLWLIGWFHCCSFCRFDDDALSAYQFYRYELFFKSSSYFFTKPKY
jgi:hypothetical protein